MKITGQFRGVRLDLRAWKRKIRKELEQKLNEAVLAWLEGVTGRVPVWSGMSQASLLAVTQMVGGTLVISPRVTSRIPQGAALGTAEKTLTATDYTITIATSVPHYTFQESSKSSRGGSPTAPWQSLLAGAARFRETARSIQLPGLVFKPVVKRL